MNKILALTLALLVVPIAHATEFAVVTITDNGTAAVPALQFGADKDNGMYVVKTDILGFSIGGIGKAAFLTDGTLMVTDTVADFDITSGTAPGSVITGHNRFYRSVNAARTGTTRLIGNNGADNVVIGGEGTGGTIVLDDKVLIQRNGGGSQQLDINRGGGSAATGDFIAENSFMRLGKIYMRNSVLVGDATAASEDGRYTFDVLRAGKMVNAIDIDPAGDTNFPVKIFINGAERRIYVDGPDTAGAGYRALRVAN